MHSRSRSKTISKISELGPLQLISLVSLMYLIVTVDTTTQENMFSCYLIRVALLDRPPQKLHLRERYS